MPRCWLVLLRFWLRVDKVLVRLRETRYFCDTAGAPATVLREVKHSEGTFAQLRAGGAPLEGVRSGCSPPVPTLSPYDDLNLVEQGQKHAHISAHV